MSARQMPTQRLTETAGTSEVQDLGDAPEHPADLQERQQHRQQPAGDQPVHPAARAGDARARDAGERLEAGLAGGDGVAPELALDDGLDGAA